LTSGLVLCFALRFEEGVGEEMKRHKVVLAVITIGVYAVCAFALPQFLAYFKQAAVIAENSADIGEYRDKLAILDSQVAAVFDDGLIGTLPEAVAEIMSFGAVEVREIYSFVVNGDVPVTLAPVTDVQDVTICDGYELVIVTSDIPSFVLNLDESRLSVYDLTLDLASGEVSVRVRTGGGHA
jgi:hypothetical protein